TIAIFLLGCIKLWVFSCLERSAQKVPAPCSRYNHPSLTNSPKAILTVCLLTSNCFINSLSECIFSCGLINPSKILDFIDCFIFLYFASTPLLLLYSSLPNFIKNPITISNYHIIKQLSYVAAITLIDQLYSFH